MKVYLTVGNVYTTVKCEDFRVHKLLYDVLSYTVPNAKIIARRNGWSDWDGKKSFYETRPRRFYTGFLRNVLRAIVRVGYEFEIEDGRGGRKAPELAQDAFNLAGGIRLYDYQQDAVTAFLGEERGILKLATGAGKTECAIAVTKILDRPTLFLTHRVELLYQTEKRFKKRLPVAMLNDIGLIGGSHFEPGQRIVLSTVQTIDAIIRRYRDLQEAKKSKKKTDKERNLIACEPEIRERFAKVLSMLERTELLVIDEAHRCGSTQFSRPAALAKNARFRLALTATPFMKPNPADNMTLLGLTGPVVYEVGNAALIQDETLARPLFKFQDINHPAQVGKLKHWRDVYEQGIVDNEYRNAFIALQTDKLVGMGRKPLVIVQEVRHGATLARKMMERGMNVRTVHGGHTTEQRQDAVDALVSGTAQALIATNIFDEGIDVSQIDALVLAAGGKAPIALFQRVGRAIRKKAEDNYAVIVDFMDRFHKKLLQHSRMRYNLVQQEPGFTIL